MLDIDNAKTQASALATYLRTIGQTLKRTHALEAVARMNGHKSWNTFKAGAPDISGSGQPFFCGADLAVQLASHGVTVVLLDGLSYEIDYKNLEILDAYEDIIRGTVDELDVGFTMDSTCVELVRNEGGRTDEESLTVKQLSNASYNRDGTWLLGNGSKLQLIEAERSGSLSSD